MINLFHILHAPDVLLKLVLKLKFGQFWLLLGALFQALLLFDHLIALFGNDGEEGLLLEENLHLVGLLVGKCARLFVQTEGFDVVLLCFKRHAEDFVGEADIVVDFCVPLCETGP